MIRYLIVSLFFLLACVPRHHKGKIISEAKSLQIEAINTGQIVAQQLSALDQRRISIEIQGRGLTAEELKFIDQVRNLTSRFEIWEKNRPAFNGEPEKVLEQQKNYLLTIQSLKEQAALLLE